MNIHHGLNVLFGSLPTLPNQRVVELLSGRVFPFRRVFCAWDRRHLTLKWQLRCLSGSAFLSEVWYLVERVQISVLPVVNGTLGGTRRMRGI